MQELNASAVFTPNDFPTHTYVKRAGVDVEQALAVALRIPKAVISISGPSKSGKTVVVEQVIGAENIILVSGAEIKQPDDIWNKVLDWMGAPSETTNEEGKASGYETGGEVEGTGKVPFLAELTGKASYRRTSEKDSGKSETWNRGGIEQVRKEIADSAFVVFLDDFHYMDRALQSEVARYVKTGAERGIRFCIASVPHRSDDVVRGNPELRGRTTNINTSFWSLQDLRQIAEKGFSVLNCEIPTNVPEALANEACGSPQLMQSLCLSFCFSLNILNRPLAPRKIAEAEFDLGQILEMSSAQTDYSSLVRTVHQGPRVRGMERKVHAFTDGSRGDVYRAVLLALAKNPPLLEIPYQALIDRIASVCPEDPPSGSSVISACKQMAQMARAMHPDQRIIEFDDDAGAGVLSIVDPYLLFFLRASKKLQGLAQ